MHGTLVVVFNNHGSFMNIKVIVYRWNWAESETASFSISYTLAKIGDLRI